VRCVELSEASWERIGVSAIEGPPVQAEVVGGQGFQIGHRNSQVNNFIVDQRRPESPSLPVRLPD
jgi:hypothetical protein